MNGTNTSTRKNYTSVHTSMQYIEMTAAQFYRTEIIATHGLLRRRLADLPFLLHQTTNKSGNKTQRRQTTQLIRDSEKCMSAVDSHTAGWPSSVPSLWLQKATLFPSHEMAASLSFSPPSHHKKEMVPLPLTQCIQLPRKRTIIWPPSRDSSLHYAAILHTPMSTSINSRGGVTPFYFIFTNSNSI